MCCTKCSAHEVLHGVFTVQRSRGRAAAARPASSSDSESEQTPASRGSKRLLVRYKRTRALACKRDTKATTHQVGGTSPRAGWPEAGQMSTLISRIYKVRKVRFGSAHRLSDLDHRTQEPQESRTLQNSRTPAAPMRTCGSQ